ncbi:MAG: hypothetical protein ACLQME_24785 [Alphaproteobacteria bacterium]
MKYWPRKRGGSFKSSYNQKLAAQYRAAFPYILYDLCNCLFHARILMDRTIHLSRLFLTRAPLPSFTSFHDHKKFFQRKLGAVLEHGEYGRYIAEKTEWFDIPIKLVRDKFFVHAGPKHMAYLAFPGAPRGFEIGLFLLVPTNPNDAQYLKEVRHISVSIPRLMDDIDGFLHWFADYGVRALTSMAPDAALYKTSKANRLPIGDGVPSP